MPESQSPANPQVAKSLDHAVFALGVVLAKLMPGSVAQLRRASPGGDGSPVFWRVYFQQKLDAQKDIESLDWEWVFIALARLTPTGNDPDKRSVHDKNVPLGRALAEAGVSELRVAKVLNAPLPQRRELLMRLVWVLARAKIHFDTVELAKLLLFGPDRENKQNNALRNLARHYYAAKAADGKAV